MPKVSVIIPVFGVEKYIVRCARSLFEQTMQDLEFIFVDDCSRDNSIHLLIDTLKEYPNRQSQVQILRHTHNLGLPSARKTGITAANGDYIINCDSDDWVSKDYVQLLYSSAIQQHSDIAICDFCYVTDLQINRIQCCYSESKEAIIADLCSNRITWSLCNKLFRKSLFNSSIVFPTESMGEDMALTLQLVLNANRFSYVPQPLYYYYCNSNSITRLYSQLESEKRYLQLLNNTSIILKALNSYKPNKALKDLIQIIKWNARKPIWGLTYDKKYFKQWKDTFPEINKFLLFNNKLMFSEKIRFVLTLIHLYPKRKDRIRIDNTI